MSMEDTALLQTYARTGHEPAFAALVERHVGLVYSAARRQVRDPQIAEDVTQAVFVILARKAARLTRHPGLSGWLLRTTRYTANAHIRAAARRANREQEAAMLSESNEPAAAAWTQLEPLLDEAMASLNETDRAVLALRYFENKSASEIGATLKLAEDTAQKRAARALEKLRKFFGKKGVALSAAALAATVSAHSVQAAPVGLAKTISAAAVVKGAAASTSTLTLVKGALKIMAWTNAKTAAVVAAGILVAAGTTTVVVKEVAHAKLSATDPSWADDPKYWESDSRVLEKLPAGVFILRPTRFPRDGGGVGVNDRTLRKNVAIQELIANAYKFSDVRILFPDHLPQDRYDLLVTPPLPSGRTLKDEIQRRFGLVAHTEVRNTEVLLLRVNHTGGPGLRVSSQGLGSSMASPHEITIHHQQFDGFASSLEWRFRKPVIDQTGLNQDYDIHIQWQARPGQTDREAFRQALLDQLGLELVPANQPLEMLVVEKAP